MNNEYENWSKEDLLNELNKLRKRKRYGLVWDSEKEPEETVEKCREYLPILSLVPERTLGESSESQNLIIEGDNYHSLSCLSYTHKNSIDVIYIDPPYNTGNSDFTYNDKFVDKEDGFRHSKWLNFIEKRISLAKNLLKDDGVIFISIDDNEVFALKLLLDNIFGENNFVGLLPRLIKKGGKSSDYIAKNHDYVIVYFKSSKSSLKQLDHSDSGFKHKDQHFEERGFYKLNQTLDYSSIQYSKSLDYEIDIDGSIFRPGGVTKQEMEKRIERNPPRDFCWRWSKDLFKFGYEKDFIVVKKYKNKPDRIYTKTYQNATISKDKNKYFVEIIPRTKPITSIDLLENEYSNDIAKKELRKIFGEVMFDYPKPTSLIKLLLEISTENNSTILDFFAGSGTTGHAVMELNKMDGGNRRFILCTNNENDIAEKVCYPRIKKVIEGYEKNKDKIASLGGNLRYYKTDFIDSAKTDANRALLTQKAVDMLCIKEGAFDSINDKTNIKIFENHEKFLAILLNTEDIDQLKKEIEKLNKPVSVYIFSLGNDLYEEQFEAFGEQVTLSPIPEAIYKVYKRIFK